MMVHRRLSGLVLLVLTVGCTHLGPPATQAPRTASAAVDARDQPCIPTSHGCIALNPDVTAANVKLTICVPGFAGAVRPSSRYTQGVKRRLLHDAGLETAATADYELDHIVPLALGGDPRKPGNLALQPWEGAHGAHRKDALETRLHAEVCRGAMSLQEAQACIAENWEACAARHAAR